MRKRRHGGVDGVGGSYDVEVGDKLYITATADELTYSAVVIKETPPASPHRSQATHVILGLLTLQRLHNAAESAKHDM